MTSKDGWNCSAVETVHVYLCIHRIKANLSGAALKFYDREFSFFKKITDISGIIRYCVTLGYVSSDS